MFWKYAANLSQSYIKRFVSYNLYDSQSVSNFYCVYTIIEDVHTEFKKVVLTEYSAFKSSSKIIQEQAATAIIIALISRKASQGKREKRRVCETLA